MNQVLVRQISQNDMESVHTCLDRVAHERKYPGLTQAPPSEGTSQIAGWCNPESGSWAGFTHCGRLGMGLMKQRSLTFTPLTLAPSDSTRNSYSRSKVGKNAAENSMEGMTIISSWRCSSIRDPQFPQEKGL